MFKNAKVVIAMECLAKMYLWMSVDLRPNLLTREILPFSFSLQYSYDSGPQGSRI